MSQGLTLSEFFLALSGGLLPSLIWLWFWLKEDKENPEPRKFVITVFLAGMVSVALALFFENETCRQFKTHYGFDCYSPNKDVFLTATGAVVLLVWAIIEELFKYFAAWFAALRNKIFDEPIDAPIYLITAALGFASAENILFVFKSFSRQGALAAFLTGDLRFVGATLLHVATSALVGASIAFCFFHKNHRTRNAAGGIILASLLHFIFNYSIMNYIETGAENIFWVFAPLWVVALGIIFIFEKIKKIKEN